MLVEEVVSSGVAEKAGIEAGDIITRFAGVNVTGEYELLREVLSHNLGDTVDIAIERKQDGEYMEIEGTITLGEGGSLSLTVSDEESTEEAADAEDAKDEGADADASSAFATGLFDRVAPPEDLDVLTGVLEDYYKCKSERNVEKMNTLMREPYPSGYIIPGDYDIRIELVNVYCLAINNMKDYAVSVVYNIWYKNIPTPVPGYNLFIVRKDGNKWELSYSLNGDITFDDDWISSKELADLQDAVKKEFEKQAAEDASLKEFLEKNDLYDEAGAEKLYAFDFEPDKKYLADEFYLESLNYYDDDEYVKAFDGLEALADDNYVLALAYLGDMYYYGDGVKQDYDKAMELYLKAAEEGDSYAQSAIGNMYDFGEGVEQDYLKAYEWYSKSAEQDNYLAQYYIGTLYFDGSGLEQDYDKAFEWFLKSAEQGYEYAQLMVGGCYEYGTGVEQDYSAAAEWYLKAAEQGNAEAQNDLGVLYAEGHGVDQDYSVAAEWYQKAAEQGYAQAQNNLGVLYAEGHGVEKNMDKAKELITQAAEQGCEDAQENLKNFK